MEVLLVDNSPKDKQYNDPLYYSLSGLSDCIRIPHGEIEKDPTITQEFGAVVLSGVPIHYTNNSIENRQERMDWLKTAANPILGICMGHQAIGRVFEAEIRKDEGQEGYGEIATFENDAIFANLGSKFTVETYHKASVTVPEEFSLLASTAEKGCKNQIMRHKELPIYGFQFHPEFSGAVGRVLLKNFVDLAKKPESLPIEETSPLPVRTHEQTSDLAA